MMKGNLHLLSKTSHFCSFRLTQPEIHLTERDMQRAGNIVCVKGGIKL